MTVPEASSALRDIGQHLRLLVEGGRLLAKPFRRHELAQMIRQALDDRRASSRS